MVKLRSVLITVLPMILLSRVAHPQSPKNMKLWYHDLEGDDTWFIRDPGDYLAIAVESSTPGVEMNVTLSPFDKLKGFVHLSCDRDGGNYSSCVNFIMSGVVHFHVRFNASAIDRPEIGNLSTELKVVPVKGTQLEMPPLHVVIVDTRKLRIGFRDEELELRNGSIALNVATLDDNIHLAHDLEILVNLSNHLHQSVSQHVTISSPKNDVEPESVTFDGLDPTLTYTATLSIVTDELADQVELVRPTLQRAATVHDVLNEVLDLRDIVSEIKQKYLAVKEELDAVKEELDILKNTNPTETAEPTTLSTPCSCADEHAKCSTAGTCECMEGFSGEGGEDVTCVETIIPPSAAPCSATIPCAEEHAKCTAGTCECMEGFSGEGGEDVKCVETIIPPSAAPCSATIPCADEHAKCTAGTCKCMEGFSSEGGEGVKCVKPTIPLSAASSTPCSATNPCAEHAKCTADLTCKCEEGYKGYNEDGPGKCVVNTGGNGFFWWIFCGLVVALVMCVAGYLLFSHREKVRVYVVTWWKGSDNGRSRSLPLSTKSRKYKPLPTSIHDTLTHED